MDLGLRGTAVGLILANAHGNMLVSGRLVQLHYADIKC